MVRRARRRYLVNLLLNQSVRSVSVVLGGAILLLILGTQVLDWRWLSALVALGVAAGFRTLYRGIPTRYLVAQRIDARLGLADTISTALFFESNVKHASEELRRAQAVQAGEAAARVDVASAVPLAFPRSAYAMLFLALVASSLFALRYGISRTLDLRPPLAALVLDRFSFPLMETAERTKPEPRKAENRREQFGIPVDQETGNQAPGNLPGLSGETQESEAAKEAAGNAAKQRGSASAETLDQRSPGTESGEGSGDAKAEPSASRTDNATPDSKGESSGRPGAAQQANASHENNGLLDRFRDAVSNLLSRLKSQPQRGGDQSVSNSQRGQERNRRMRDQSGASQSGRQAEGSPEGQAEGDQQGEGQEEARSGAGKQGGRDAQQASTRGQTGIGKSDGSKDVREAEQLAAMGKISEILGKRSRNLTGEVMVEVASGKQELRTAYSQQSARHADTGGEIHRDEIPLAYERYVQQYFEQVRKTPAPAAPKPENSPAPTAP